jgi:hypothetical protein
MLFFSHMCERNNMRRPALSMMKADEGDKAELACVRAQASRTPTSPAMTEVEHDLLQ